MAPGRRHTRSARILTCAADSSPHTSSTGRSRATWSSICSSSVDLPMPGSPPTSTSEPGTMPPPSTRSSSAMPLLKRSAADETTSDRATGPEAAPPAPSRTCLPLLPARPRAGATTASSTNESQAPQSGQWPSHLLSWRPHPPQTKTVPRATVRRPAPAEPASAALVAGRRRRRAQAPATTGSSSPTIGSSTVPPMLSPFTLSTGVVVLGVHEHDGALAGTGAPAWRRRACPRCSAGWRAAADARPSMGS